MPSPKIKRQPPERDFDKYFATFQSDPLKKTVGLKSINPSIWQQFGPILSSSNGYVEYIQEPSEGSVAGGNTPVKDIGFDFTFDGVTYKNFIASPHGWLALLDPTNVPTVNTGTIYDNRLLISGSSSFNNSAIKQAFTYDDLLLAPWFDRLMMTHRDLDSFVNFFSGSNSEIAGQKERFLFGKTSAKSQPYNERDFGMKYAVVDDSVDGKALVVRWASMGYEYRGTKLAFEAALYQNGKIEFGYAPLDSYSTQYTLVSLSSDPVNVWKLDESTGSTATDTQSNKNLTYKTPNQMRPTPGLIVSSSFFSGSSGFQDSNTLIYADDGSFANYGATDSFSFSAWFKSASGDSSTKTILSRMNYSSPYKGYSIQLAGGYLQLDLIQSFNTNLLRVQSSGNTYNDGQWHHVVCTYNGTADSSGVKIYVDGQTISTTVPYSSLTVGSNIKESSSSADFMIGGTGKYTGGSNTNHFTGSIDDVARWNSVLNTNDVELLYAQGLEAISAADIEPLGDSTTSYATCGIFASGSSTWNYRDFAPLLGVMSASRKTSEFGGALYTGSYYDVDSETNVSADYAVNIGINNWPRHGGKITFSPPQRRRQLNKLDIYEDEKKDFFGEGIFDDRKSITYSTQSNVDASTALPLSAIVTPTYPGVHLKQNLISSGGIRIPNREVISAGHSAYVGDETESRQKIAPFSESALPEQGRRTEEFFATGSVSYIGNWRRAFSRNLSNKKSIRMSFPVDRKTKLFTSGSSLYYYNVSSGQWNIPTSSLVDHASSSLQKLSVDTTGAGGTCNGSLYLEDKIGFDSQGNAIISGNLDIFRSTSGNTRNQSTSEIATLFNTSNHANILIPEYPKSIQRNSSYEASSDEVFTLPLDDTFLIEKAVIEIPFCMGDGWFSDKTVFTFVSASNFAHTGSGGTTLALAPFSFLDEGGPAVTVALFCQRNHGTGSVRDLVCKSTFTHADDELKDVGFSFLDASGSTNLVHGVSLIGNESNSNILSDYVTYQTVNSRKQFTGSILINLDASITNCANIGVIKGIQTANVSTSSILTSFDNFLSSEFVSANSITAGLDRLSYLLNFDSFGRSMSGFSAGSGGEYITTDNVLFGSSVRNPFYVSGSTQRQSITSSLQSQINSLGTGSYIYCMTKIQLGGPKQLPYITRPGDKFVLAVSKSRPTLKNVDIRIGPGSLSTGKIINVVSSSYYNNISTQEGHDITFNTGSINITLYGSSVQAGGEVS